MSWTVQHPLVLWAGLWAFALGTVFMAIGELAIVIGLVLYAVGLGSVAAAYTIVEGDGS